jgi:hypothetical protein
MSSRLIPTAFYLAPSFTEVTTPIYGYYSTAAGLEQ